MSLYLNILCAISM